MVEIVGTLDGHTCGTCGDMDTCTAHYSLLTF